jgi:hypothetical protein
MKKLLLAASFLCALAGAANADLILVQVTPTGVVPAPTVAASFTDLGAQGFGAAPRMLTLQTNGVETGNVTPVDVVHGDAVPGANKSTTPTLATLQWTSGANVGIGFNSDQSGQTGITMQSLVLTIFNGTTAVGSFSLAPSLTPLTFTAADLALQQGNGNAVFDFGLTAAEQTQFNAILAMPGSSGFFAGLSSSLGCATPVDTAPVVTSCLVSNDGPDTFIGFRQVPGPMVGAGLPGLIAACGGLLALARRRRQLVV